jgi:hypothetical protein
MSTASKVLFVDVDNAEIIAFDDDELSADYDGYLNVGKYVLEDVGRIDATTVFVPKKAKKTAKK